MNSGFRKWQLNDGNGIRKIAPQKIALQKIDSYENTPYEYSSLWKLPPVKITPRKFSPEKMPPGKITPNEIPSLLINHANEKNQQNYKIFCLEESCAIQHPYENNQGPLWYTNDLTENTGFRYFLYWMKKIQISNESENRQVDFTCQLDKSRRTNTRQSN